mmetsp:Transcript_38262/g.56349  ORF Transcript_38262/g.56349 Transcript_38262/m.56349 type:complete len:432 (+) Transcript_38262:61-1356(+)|eukprot:CAMPEP_0195538418 /NCGR_PEP_ID=MMETSP0794_2-20130614/49515_1 /TAXON_ID=515487 /ORGANISM="Stephanopyxis turris, Strain CCMP 815" /LENGTH=431 /DNA_ID=CAMNT_0040672395 /DNA_START=851 /DNA_END=2146 /DNA_ORIENTATION=-
MSNKLPPVSALNKPSQRETPNFASAKLPDDARQVSTSNSADVPKMRSVAMAPSPGSVPIFLPRPESFHKSLRPRVDPKVPEQKPHTSNWNVKDDSLEFVPDHFVLERTTRVINGTATTVSARISECLRQRSIAVVYDDEKAKAKCRNYCFVQFRIRLFAGKDDCAHCVIVEVQRRSGSVLSFHRDCCAILDAAEGFINEGDSHVPRRNVSDMDFAKCEDEELRHQRRKINAASALEVASDLLQKDRIDANELGIESLCALTDSNKTNPETALIASSSIILDKENSEIRDIIASLVEKGLLPGEEEEDESIYNDDHHSRLCNLALVVLSNALVVAEKESSLREAVRGQLWFVDYLVQVLVGKVGDAHLRPHEAFLAAKSLNALVKISDEARNKAISLDAPRILSDANEFGNLSHESLAGETARVVTSLQIQC